VNTNYQIIYSQRKSLALEITRELAILVRAPLGTKQEVISSFVSSHQSWISNGLTRMSGRNERHPEQTALDETVFRAQAKDYIPRRVAYYSAKMGLRPTSIRITSAKTRFGSCSGENRICFSWRLMAYPEEAIDYVVVHELAHILHKNHGHAFYACIAAILPDWKERRRLLR